MFWPRKNKEEGRFAPRSSVTITKTPFEIRWLRKTRLATSQLMLAAIDFRGEIFFLGGRGAFFLRAQALSAVSGNFTAVDRKLQMLLSFCQSDKTYFMDKTFCCNLCPPPPVSFI